MDERRMTNEQRERERRRKAAAARKAAARYEDPGVGYQRRRRARTSPCQKRVYSIAGDLYSCHWTCRWNNILDKVWADKRNL